MTKIRQLSKSHVIYSGLEVFRNAPEGFKIDLKDVPGLRACCSDLNGLLSAECCLL